MVTRSALGILLTSTILATLGGGAAAAQQAGEATATPAEQGTIAEVIVTARRREESLQSAPVTVTAFSGQELQRKNVTDVTRLLQISPGVNSWRDAAARAGSSSAGDDRGGRGPPEPLSSKRPSTKIKAVPSPSATNLGTH